MNEKNTPVVAFIGLGSMGLGMAKNLLKHGHKVIGVDPSAAARDAFAKALVRHVEERRQSACFDDADDLVPLRRGDVVARGVVAASVQQHHRPSGSRLQGGQHAVEVHAALGGVVVGIGLDREAGLGEQCAVVFPAWIADQHLGVGQQVAQKVGTDFQTARAAQALHGGHAAAFDGLGVSTKHQALDGRVIGGNAIDRQVAPRGRRLHEVGFGLLHALEQGQFAVVVEIDPDAEVHLVGVGVGGELLVQTQDWVAGGHLDRKSTRLNSSHVKRSRMPSSA